MKIFGISVYEALPDGQVTPLIGVFNESLFGFFDRSSAIQFMKFMSRTVSERANPGRSTIKEQIYEAHVRKDPGSVVVVVLTDEEYPSRVAFDLISKIISDLPPKSEWKNFSLVRQNSGSSSSATSQTAISMEERLKADLIKYQDPKNADKILKVQKELEDTKVVLYDTVEALLRRGENLDSLVDKTNDLSFQTKAFYKTAKKTNSCCASW